MATRTSTTRTTRPGPAPSADSFPPTLEDVVTAYLNCRRHKRNSRAAVEFSERLEHNLVSLHEELLSGQYAPGRSICFVVTHPKPREVWAANFRDRIVHHLLYNRIGPAIEATFIHDSCACIKGRGTLYAAKRLEHHVRSVSLNWSRPAWFLKCDLSNFFVSISKDVVFEQIQKKVRDPWWLALTRTILFHDPRNDVDVRGDRARLSLVPPHKSLFNAPPGYGLPIGNLSSQFFANVRLNILDRFIKHRLRGQRYVRYVDDFVLLHQDPAWLNQALMQITEFLDRSPDLRLNPSKTALQPIAHGIDFVGQIVRPWRRVPRPRTVNVALDRLAAAGPGQRLAAGNSYLGLMGQASKGHADAARVANTMRRLGHSVAADFSKAYRSAI